MTFSLIRSLLLISCMVAGAGIASVHAIELSAEANEALRRPQAELQSQISSELNDALRLLVAPVFTETLGKTDIEISSEVVRLWLERKPFLKFEARASDRAADKTVLVHLFHGAGPEGVEDRFGKWFIPAQVGDDLVKSVDFPADVASAESSIAFNPPVMMAQGTPDQDTQEPQSPTTDVQNRNTGLNADSGVQTAPFNPEADGDETEAATPATRPEPNDETELLGNSGEQTTGSSGIPGVNPEADPPSDTQPSIADKDSPDEQETDTDDTDPGENVSGESRGDDTDTELLPDPQAAAIPQQRQLSMKREITLVIQCEKSDVCREQQTGQPLRVLPRTFTHLYKSKSAELDNIAIENVAAYRAMYVFARDDLDHSNPVEPKGWYQVGYSLDEPALGWMQAGDALEWKQALIASYRHPGFDDMKRAPVLMFRSLEDLREVVESPVRDGLAMLLYQKVERSDIPPSLVSKEPERFVDIDRKFYLLPILDFEVAEIDGDELRYLKLAAAVPGKRGADVLENEVFREQAETPPAITEESGQTLEMDVVFVIDMSRSMQPYIDSTRNAIEELVQSLAGNDFGDSVRFGLVGYRDDTQKIPALEFTSRNFTPDLVNVDEFIELLEQEARATSIGSMDYPEEVYAGVETGLDSNWTPGALRFLVLVGDASAHDEDHAQSTTGKNAGIINLAARAKGVRVLALHLIDPRMPSDHSIAKRQFTELSRIEGSEESALVQLSTDDKTGFSAAVKDSAGVIYQTLATARQKVAEPVAVADTSDAEPSNDSESTASDAQQAMEKLMESALIEYLGKEADPPKDIVMWTLDRDIANPILNALDIRVLLSKDQLSDLVKGIDHVTKALARAEYSHQQFFEALQGVAGQTLKQPEAIDQAETLVETGLLPSFIRSLPYKSEVLSLSDEMYAAMTAEQRSALESNLRAKLRQYQDINEQVDGWISLNESDDADSRVYPLFLDYLP